MMREPEFVEAVRGRAQSKRSAGGGASPYVEHLLCAWGAWSRRAVAGGIGFPSCSPMFKDAPVGKGYASRPPLGIGTSDCCATDLAVQRLSPEDRRLCVEVYRIGGKTVEVAARLGWYRERVSRRLQVVHGLVLGHLNDIAADS